MTKISVILNTYNRPRALALALYSLLRQSETDFEVILADDGSREDTWKLVEKFQKLYGKRLSHQWQEDQGCRRARILNRAVDVAKAPRLLILDENAFAHRHLVRDHLAASGKGDLYRGARIALSPDLSDMICEEPAKIDTLEFWRRSFFATRLKNFDGYNFSVAKDWVQTIGGFDEFVTEKNAELRDFYGRMTDAGASFKESAQSAVQWCLQDEVRPSAELSAP